MSDSESLPPPPESEGVVETAQFVQPADPFAVAGQLLSAGTRMGHYVVKKYIGGGGMGQVYLAADEALDRDVAIKILTQQRAGDQGTVARFMNEARSAARLNHEHIAQVYFAGETSGIPFIAFEYVEGINVRTMVEEHDVFPLPQALNYLLQIAHALAHAATHGVIHRDVKPSNILITREGRAKLIDMGLARLSDTSEARGDLTASGVTLGTFDYISPEQARDPRNADIRSDIYSLGCTFFFMLAGRPPFPEGTVLQKLLQHQGDAPPDIRSFQPTIPAEIAFLIQKMMAKDPKQRFQTPAVLIDALTDVARRLGLRPAGQGSLVWTSARPNRMSLVLQHLPWITAVLLLLVGTFLMTLILDSSKPLPLPDALTTDPPTSPTVTEAVPPLVEPASVPSRSFDVAFVSHPVASSSQYLTASTISGGLQPALRGMGNLANSSSGTLSVADVRPANQHPANQRAVLSPNVRIVDPTGNTIGSYPSLASALTDAGDGTIIELKWNGTYRIAEPVRLDSRHLQFVAAAGFEPILFFEPTELQRSLFTVFSSGLGFERVGIEIRLRQNVRLQHWSLFELAGNVRLAFEQCCLTIQNRVDFDDSAYHDDVVFFRNSLPTFLEGTNSTADAVFEPLIIDITNSLLRGEAVALRSNVPQDIQVQLTNSLVALAKPFLHVAESRRAAKQATIQIQWDRVTFFGRQGVADLQKETTEDPMIVHFDSQRSVFVLNRSPFAVFRGLQSRQSVLEDFRWSGSTNYFQGVSGLRFRPISLLLDSGTAYEMPLDEWRQQWSPDTDEQTKINVLTLNDIGKPMSRYVPQDIQSAFSSTDNVPLPDLRWFSTRWYNN